MRFERWANLDKRTFLFPFLRQFLDFYSQKFADKVRKLRRHRKKMLKNREENLELFHEHSKGLMDLFSQSRLFKAASEKELFRKKGFIMLMLRDLMAEAFIREEDALYDFHEEDEYFDVKKPSRKCSAKEKPVSPGKTGGGESEEEPRRRDQEEDESSDDDGADQRGRNFYQNFSGEDFSDTSAKSSRKSSSRSEPDFEEHLGGDDAGRPKPFLLRFFEEFARKHFEKVQSAANASDLERRMSEFLCYFFVMLKLDQEPLALLFSATRHVRYRSEFGEILLANAIELNMDTRRLVLDYELLHALIFYFFSNLGEAIKAVVLEDLLYFVNSAGRLYSKMNSNKSFREFLKRDKRRLAEFRGYQTKLELFEILSAFLQKQMLFFGQEQVRLLFAILWKSPDIGQVLFQNITELKTSNEEFKRIDRSSQGWDRFWVGKAQLDLFLETSTGDADLSKVFSASQKRPETDRGGSNVKLKSLREQSREFECIAERLILLAVLTQKQDDPTFQQLLQVFFCRYVNAILKEKLVLTHQGNFSAKSEMAIEDDDDTKVSHTVTLFGVLIEMSRNLLEMANYIICEVKDNKAQYRRVLSFLHALRNQNFITILIDKLTFKQIDELEENRASNPVLKAFKADRIKRTEVEIVRAIDEDLAKGRLTRNRDRLFGLDRTGEEKSVRRALQVPVQVRLPGHGEGVPQAHCKRH